MVIGLERFKEHFAAYTDQFVLIGGTACTLLMENAGLQFRATKDLDIVLHVEALGAEFVRTFWQFIKSGGYQNRQKSTGKDIYYRFSSPSNVTFPTMLELFSRIPDVIKLDEKIYLTPIPINEAVTSLSAIVLDSDYYEFIHLRAPETSAPFYLICFLMVKKTTTKPMTDKTPPINDIDENAAALEPVAFSVE